MQIANAWKLKRKLGGEEGWGHKNKNILQHLKTLFANIFYQGQRIKILLHLSESTAPYKRGYPYNIFFSYFSMKTIRLWVLSEALLTNITP